MKQYSEAAPQNKKHMICLIPENNLGTNKEHQHMLLKGQNYTVLLENCNKITLINKNDILKPCIINNVPEKLLGELNLHVPHEMEANEYYKLEGSNIYAEYNINCEILGNNPIMEIIDYYQ